MDILVNNAGISAREPLADYKPEAFKAIMDLNVTAVFNGCKAVEPIMRARRGRRGRCSEGGRPDDPVLAVLCFLELPVLFFGGGLPGHASHPVHSLRGGGAQQIVTQHGWLGMAEFTDLVTISQMTPADRHQRGDVRRAARGGAFGRAGGDGGACCRRACW